MDVKVRPLPDHKRDGAYDAGAAHLIDEGRVRGVPRARQVLDGDGTPQLNPRTGNPVQERLRRPPSEKWVSQSGTVAHVRLSGGSGFAPQADPARMQRTRERMYRDHAIRYGLCPLRDPVGVRWVPPSMREDQPCEPGTHGEHKACRHVEQIIKMRRDEHNTRERLQAEKFKSVSEKQLEQSAEQHQATIQALAKAIESGRGGKRGG